MTKKATPGTAGKAPEKSVATTAGKAPEKPTATVTGKALVKEVPPNSELQIIPQENTGAAPTSGSLQTTAVSWGFAPLKTLSGNSLGSLEHYHMDWNAADTDEVTSQHPAGPSILAQKMFAAKAAILEADKAAEVSTAE